jgi:hypothetical protein
LILVHATGSSELHRTGGEVGEVEVSLDVEPLTTLGGVLLATVRTTSARDVVLQGGEVTLTRSFAYRYNEGFFGAAYTATARRRLDVATDALPGPTLLRAGTAVEQQALLPVPDGGPPTLESDLAAVRWTVSAHVRYEGSARADAEPVLVRVLGAGRGAAVEGPARVHGRRRLDDVRLDAVAVDGAESRQLRSASRITGVLVVQPRRPGRLEEVSVELVLVTLVPHGPWLVDDPSRNPEPVPKESESVVVREVLAGPTLLPDTTPMRWRFTIGAPPVLPAPTWAGEEFSVRWLLRGRVVRPRLSTARIDLELDGSSLP